MTIVAAYRFDDTCVYVSDFRTTNRLEGNKTFHDTCLKFTDIDQRLGLFLAGDVTFWKETIPKISEIVDLCQLAGTDNEHGWYTTNIAPNNIRVLLEDGDTVRDFLSAFCEKGVWEALESAYHGELGAVTNDIIKFLGGKGMVKGNKLTPKGFTCYAVLGHLAFNMNKKLDINKIIEISKLVYDLTGIYYGERLPYSMEEFIKMISGHPDYNDLVNKGVSIEDIGKYLRQNNISA